MQIEFNQSLILYLICPLPQQFAIIHGTFTSLKTKCLDFGKQSKEYYENILLAKLIIKEN